MILITAVPGTSYGEAQHKESKNVECLARNIYFESRGESELGQMAVALVTLNRTVSDKFPRSVCSVVYQKKQFSWVSMKLKITDMESYHRAREIAEQMYEAFHLDDIPDSLRHVKHALYFDGLGGVNAKQAQKKHKIGKHVFY